MTEQTTVRTKQLKFGDAPRHLAISAFEEGDEAATVRYQDDKDIATGDRLSLRTPDDVEFGTAVVTRVIECYAWRAYAKIEQRGARYGRHSSAGVIAALNHHYDDTIWPSTWVKVVFYRPESLDEEEGR